MHNCPFPNFSFLFPTFLHLLKPVILPPVCQPAQPKHSATACFTVSYFTVIFSNLRPSFYGASFSIVITGCSVFKFSETKGVVYFKLKSQVFHKRECLVIILKFKNQCALMLNRIFSEILLVPIFVLAFVTSLYPIFCPYSLLN